MPYPRLASWEVVSDVPLGYLSDEVSICYLNGRIYCYSTGNKTRRVNGSFDQVLYYTLSSGQWSTPITLGNNTIGYYGHDKVALAAIDNKLYSLHTRLSYNSDTDTATRGSNYADGYSVPRSLKTIMVHDQEFNLLNKIDLNLRRPIVTSHFGSNGGNLYAFIGSNPKCISHGDGRQNYLFSYVDIRMLDNI